MSKFKALYFIFEFLLKQAMKRNNTFFLWTLTDTKKRNERIKENSFEPLHSSLTPGHNLSLFDLSASTLLTLVGRQNEWNDVKIKLKFKNSQFNHCLYFHSQMNSISFIWSCRGNHGRLLVYQMLPLKGMQCSWR